LKSRCRLSYLEQAHNLPGKQSSYGLRNGSKVPRVSCIANAAQEDVWMWDSLVEKEQFNFCFEGENSL
jgi:hypothetical protein